jgi:hypothetical protein
LYGPARFLAVQGSSLQKPDQKAKDKSTLQGVIKNDSRGRFSLTHFSAGN